MSAASFTGRPARPGKSCLEGQVERMTKAVGEIMDGYFRDTHKLVCDVFGLRQTSVNTLCNPNGGPSEQRSASRLRVQQKLQLLRQIMPLTMLRTKSARRPGTVNLVPQSRHYRLVRCFPASLWLSFSALLEGTRILVHSSPTEKWPSARAARSASGRLVRIALIFASRLSPLWSPLLAVARANNGRTCAG